jgi:hypothetical protein
MLLTRIDIGHLDHIDTVFYEIDMLRFSAERLREGNWQHPRDAWIYLETFLLHYRNLIEFLGGRVPKPNPNRPDTLHVTTIWKLTNLPEPINLAEIYTEGANLWKRYEPSDEDGGGRISQYLQHPTEKRIDPKNWPISVMNGQIEPLLAELEKHIPRPLKRVLDPAPAVTLLEPHSGSTSTYTLTASAIPDFRFRLKE